MTVNIEPNELEIVDVWANNGGRKQDKLEANAEVNYWSKGDHSRMYVNDAVGGDLYFDFGASAVECTASYREAEYELTEDGIMTITVRYVRGDTDRKDVVVKVAMNADAKRAGDEAETATDSTTDAAPGNDTEEVKQTCAVCGNKIHGEKTWKEDAWMHPGCARKVGMGALGEHNTGERDFARQHLG